MNTQLPVYRPTPTGILRIICVLWLMGGLWGVAWGTIGAPVAAQTAYPEPSALETLTPLPPPYPAVSTPALPAATTPPAAYPEGDQPTLTSTAVAPPAAPAQPAASPRAPEQAQPPAPDRGGQVSIVLVGLILLILVVIAILLLRRRT